MTTERSAVSCGRPAFLRAALVALACAALLAVSPAPASACSSNSDCNDGNVCTIDTCIKPPLLPGICTHLPTIGNSCNDDNSCTTNDTCVLGLCAGLPAPGAGCEDGNACTVGDHCDVLTRCLSGSTRICDDRSVCTTDSCHPRTGCVFAPVNCDDPDGCTVDSCDPLGGCTHAPRNCDDGNACTVDSCRDGGCVNTVSCDDGNVCTADSCVQVRLLGSTCVHLPMEGCCLTGGDCDDGDVCSGSETCEGNACVAGRPLDCDDGAVCTADSCDPVDGCNSTAIPGCCLSAAECDDNNVCNGAETCTESTCEAGAPLVCDDGDQCTEDVCDPSTGCASDPISFTTVTNAFRGGLAVGTCSAQLVPARIGKLFAKAEALIQKAAASTKAKKTKRLVKRAVGTLKKAGRNAEAGPKHISPDCAADLGAMIGEVQARAECLLATL